MKRLAIIGSNDVAQLIAHHAINDEKYKIAGFFDNKKEKGTSIGYFGKVVGTVEEVEPLFQEGFFDELIIGVGYTQFGFKKDAFNRFNAKIPMANMIHSSAYIDKSCKIGSGVVILPGCILDMGVELESNVLLNTSVSISHDSKVKAHSFIAPRVNIAGYVTVGALCFIGIGTTIIDNVKICDQVVIGAASLVLKNIEEPGTYYGHPIMQKQK
ncbi:acetyltransferase [Methylovulum psychrotolerans]|jgi:sugar O-acyltransferase (sialic acid O-acetyltransferase NeuD family)|uniref:acetyltransferase n=1 Tax=Methylovulum psychrotolerans TaxID=1704499 RepID=UPI001BFFBA19|nr:acetyltransferase [Methylovulum psychrotolerans]MBT9099539.1 acetyltransferase [Methylovulum psychrotolerans]